MMDTVILAEPITEFTAEMTVDIFDGNLFLTPVPWDGCAGSVSELPGQMVMAYLKLSRLLVSNAFR